jgi:predicted DNA-binding transcriptional regulator YafY
VLRAHARAVAAYRFDRIYATWPELGERFGPRGHDYTAMDNFWHLEHLDEVMAAGDAGLFDAYTDWLVGLLLPRGLEREHIAGAYGFLAEGLAAAACPASREAHRRELIALLRSN